eukprot:COSAG06_NODE_17613_length_930_cov_1.688327_1_plen_71_part_00
MITTVMRAGATDGRCYYQLAPIMDLFQVARAPTMDLITTVMRAAAAERNSSAEARESFEAAEQAHLPITY